MVCDWLAGGGAGPGSVLSEVTSQAGDIGAKAGSAARAWAS